MADAVIKFKIMPESVEADLEAIKSKAIEAVQEFEPIGEVTTEEQPVAFGLKAVILRLIVDENNGTDAIEEKLLAVENVVSAEVAEYSRTMGWLTYFFLFLIILIIN